MGKLNESYYHDDNGEFTRKHVVMGHCVSRNVFFILRNKLLLEDRQKINKLYKSYIEDLNFYFVIDKLDNIMGIGLKDTNFWRRFISYIDKTEYINDEYRAMEHLQDLIKKGELVLVNTMAHKIKFHNDYHLDEEEDKNNRHIYFLAMSCDESSIYYLYTYTLYNKEYYKPCNENPSIGIAPKEDFLEAFHEYVEISTFTDDFELLSDVKAHIHNSISNSINNYYGGSNENASILFGRKGLEFLKLKIITEGKLYFLYKNESLEDKSQRPLSFESLRITIIWLSNRRSQYIYLFEILELMENEIIGNLVSKLEYSINQWGAFMNFIKYLYLKGVDNIGMRGITYIDNILKADDELFAFMDINKEYLCELINKS